MVVLVIISLIAGLGIPRFVGSLGGVKLKTSARNTISLLRYARDTAFYKKQFIKVVVDLDLQKIIVLRFQGRVAPPEGEDGEKGTEPWFLFQEKKMKWVHDKALLLPEGIRIKECVKKETRVFYGKYDLVFSPVGNSSGGEIHLENARHKKFVIAVDSITGSARIIL